MSDICCKTARISFSGLFFSTKSRMLFVGSSRLENLPYLTVWSYDHREQAATSSPQRAPTTAPTEAEPPPKRHGGRIGERAPRRDAVGAAASAEKPGRCSFSGVVELSPARLAQAAISKLQCPECGAMWTAHIRGGSVLFPPHPPRTTGWYKPFHDGSNKEEPGSFLNTRGNWMESHMQRYLVNARMTWAKLGQVFGGLPPQRKSSSSECLPKSPAGIFTYPSQGRACFPLSRRRQP